MLHEDDLYNTVDTEHLSEIHWDASKVDRFLRNEDYSLDSPIILDDLIFSFNCRKKDVCTGGPVKKDLTSLYRRVENPIHPTGIHRSLFSWLESKINLLSNSSNFNAELKESATYLKDCFTVPDTTREIMLTFFKSIACSPTESEINWYRFEERMHETFKDIRSPILLYWHIYQVVRFMVLIMNSVNDKEIDAIVQAYKEIRPSLSFDWIKEEDKTTYYINEKSLGSFVLNKNGVLFVDTSLVLDKNFLLMFQDILSSRVCTFVMLMYPDLKYSHNLSNRVYRLYRKGDELLARVGNPAYDVIKMIEPLCNYKIKSLVEKNKLVISDDKFKEYLETEIKNLNQSHGHLSQNFFDVIKEGHNFYDSVLIFGLFRHWGHPYIEYLEGLEKLYHNVQCKKEVDTNYVKVLASDLARKIIKHYFRLNKMWPVNLDDLSIDHPLRKHVRDSTWPNRGEEREFGDKWDEIPFQKVFDAPTSVNLSEILDDKSHSLGLSQLRESIRLGNIGDSGQRKVLLSALKREEVNISQFLRDVDEHGIKEDDLVIGLRAKERELKRIGRFFALMTFNLRLYFVVTEMMIANHILPLFPSLTMTSSMNKVFKKMAECAPGHGTDHLTYLTYSEHFDYEKWNNHQRKESTEMVFRVIDKAFGFSNLIARTHDIFQQSFIYFANRPDLMLVRGSNIINKNDCERVCWDGQAGGLEGLRQKGWSLISLLMIERESKNRNPKVRTLAQGDNQVVCITYLMPSERDLFLQKSNYLDVFKNRTHLLSCIHAGAKKLGLIIKPDESWSSYNYLIYGKFAMIGGNLVCCESKRYSRINIVSNDLVQNMSNTISSVVTTCLTVCQQSDSITKSIHMFIVFGSWVVKSVLHYDLVAFQSIKTWKQIIQLDKEISKLLFLDSTLGGLGGASLLRFTIRQFPDAVTESLTFWKLLYHYTSNERIHELALEAGCPALKHFDLVDLLKLVESPMSLNCKTGANATSILKNLVREELVKSIEEIKHNTIRDCLIHVSNTRIQFLQFLNSISPKFPRFLSNFYSASIYGFIDSIIGLIQNSRTIRLLFTNRFTKSICEKISLSEIRDVNNLLTPGSIKRSFIWDCSAELADELRRLSWGETIGATIPHPAELVKLFNGYFCDHDHSKQDYLTCHYNIPVILYPQYLKGPCNPYMGSDTSDLTELYHAWEKKTDISLLKKALGLRNAIHWFVTPDSYIHKALISNLQSLTDEDAIQLMTPGPERAGSYIHRYSSPFQSAGGFSAICHNKLRYTLSTTDTMSGLADTNWDFMYQSVLLFGQTVVTCFQDLESTKGVVHGHISCKKCLRPVINEQLQTSMSPPVFHSLKSSNSLFISKDKIPFLLDQIKLEQLPKISSNEILSEISFQIGNTQGILHSLSICYDLKLDDMGSIFPKSVFDNLAPPKYFTGFIVGVIRGTLINSLTYQFIFSKRDRVLNFKGVLLSNLSRIQEVKDIASLISSDRFASYLSNVSHISGSHYPLNSGEILDMLKTYLIAKVSKNFKFYVNAVSTIKRVVLFPETVTAFIATSLIISLPLCQGILKSDRFKKGDIMRYKHILHLTNVTHNTSLMHLLENLKRVSVPLLVCQEDMKTISKKEIWTKQILTKSSLKYEEYEGHSKSVFLRSSTLPVDTERIIPIVPDRYSPLISGLRLVQIQTGAHYKLKCLFKHFPRRPTHVICGGDYSGGFTSQMLRKYPNILIVFNSLLDLSKFPGGGMHPAPPSGISRLPNDMRVRCLNLHTSWEESSDLTEPATWDILIKHFPKNSVDCIIIDAEVRDVESANKIVELMDLNLTRCHTQVFVVIKSYYSMIRDPSYKVLSVLSSCFERIEAVSTEYTGSFSSEIYLICSQIRRTSQERFVDESSLLELKKIVYALSDYKRELNRALNLSLVKTCAGLLSNFWVGSDVLLFGLISNMNIAPVIGQRIEIAIRRTKDFSTFFGALIFSLSYLIKEINVKVDNSVNVGEGVPVPSADWCESFGCMISGFLNLIALYTRNSSLYANVTESTNYVIFYELNHKGNFSWSFQNKNSKSIRCRVNRKKHLAATWIRIFESWRYELQHQISPIDFLLFNGTLTHEVLSLQYGKFNPDFLRNCTGFFDLMDVIMGDLSPYLMNHKCETCPMKPLPIAEETRFYHQEGVIELERRFES